jgi:hypothetical protein
MPITTIEKIEGKVLEVRMSGKLTRADYADFVPMTERLIKQWGKLSLLVVMQDFHGWDMGAVWEDIKWDVHHFNDIERVALVGEEKWQAGMSKFCKPFTSAEIRYFNIVDLEFARQWVLETAAIPSV